MRRDVNDGTGPESASKLTSWHDEEFTFQVAVVRRFRRYNSFLAKTSTRRIANIAPAQVSNKTTESTVSFPVSGMLSQWSKNSNTGPANKTAKSTNTIQMIGFRGKVIS